MELLNALLDSWERQTRIVNAVAERITEENRHALPSPDGKPLDRQLAHIHGTRVGWLSQASPSHAEGLDQIDWNGDLGEIRSALVQSGVAIGAATRDLLTSGAEKAGPYDHPVLFLQHMVWHDGWHVGLIMLGLRLAGQEPPEEWEEANVWGEWRTEEWP